MGYDHSGFWGTVVWHVPDLGITIAAAATERDGYYGLLKPLMEQSIQLLADNVQP
ncbi:MAG: hypothetical protein HOC23_13920 [Halieaceae bacterium]|nr:hypothetical protein [Halieaceae bacterium]